jgi:methionyl-tRNA formyltransferase
VRAFDPFPVATTLWRDAPLRIWQARVDAARPCAAAPGTVVASGADGIRVTTGEGELVLLELQRAGGKRLTAREFLAGTPIGAGERLGAP